MSRLVEHFQSPQFTDAEGAPTAKRYGPGLMVGTGRSRWRAYLFWAIIAVIGVAFLLNAPGWETTIAFAGVEAGVWLIIGAVLVVAAVGGFVDTFRGKLLFGFL